MKELKPLEKSDLARRRYNEESLYKKQLSYIHKVGKQYEALGYRDDIRDNEEMVEEVKQALIANKEKKRKLLQEGKAELDFGFNRLI